MVRELRVAAMGVQALMKLHNESNDHIKNSKFKLDYNNYLDLLAQGATLLATPWDATQIESFGEAAPN